MHHYQAMRITPAQFRAFGLAGTVVGLSATLWACGATQPFQLSCRAQLVDIEDGSSADYNFVLNLDPARMQGQFVPVSEAAKNISGPAFQDNTLELEVEPETLQVTHKTKWNQRLVLAFDRASYEVKSYDNQRKKLSTGWILAEPGVTNLTCESPKAADPS